MLDSAVTSGSLSPRAGQRRAPGFAWRAVLAAAVAATLSWSIVGGADTLAAQSAPKAGAESGATEPRAGNAVTPQAALDDSSAREVAREIAELAPLDEALREVHGLTQPQSDSLAVLEQRYARVFASLAGSARTLIDDASARGITPDAAELRSLCETVWTVRRAELVAARAMLATRAQRARFDANVVKVQCEEARLVEDVWNRTAGRLDGSART